MLDLLYKIFLSILICLGVYTFVISVMLLAVFIVLHFWLTFLPYIIKSIGISPSICSS